jgi:hypothetical protein
MKIILGGKKKIKGKWLCEYYLKRNKIATIV